MQFSKIFLAGRWQVGGGGLKSSINPADGSVVAEFSTADVRDVEVAVHAGMKAAAEPAWRSM